MRKILIRKFNEQRGCYEVVLELDNDNGEYELATGGFDITGRPTYEGDVVEGDIKTEVGTIKKQGKVHWEQNYQQFVIHFQELDQLWRGLPVGGVKIISNKEIEHDKHTKSNVENPVQ